MQIKKLRETRDMTQIDLAQELGVTQGVVSQWETGLIQPRADKLPALARILGCTIDDLYAKEKPAAPTQFTSPDVENDPEWAAKRAFIRERMKEQLFGNGVPKL